MRNRTNIIFNLALLVADFVALLGAFVVAYIIRVQHDPRPLLDQVTAITFLKIFLLILPLWLIIFALLGLYKAEENENRLTESLKIFVGTVGGTMVVTFLDFISETPIYPARLVLVYGFLLSLIFVLITRQFMHWLRRYLFRFGIGIRRVVLVGDGRVGANLLKTMADTKHSGYKVLAMVTDRPVELPKNVKLFKDFGEIPQKFNVKQIDEIIQAELYKDDRLNTAIMFFAHTHHIDYKFFPTPSALYSAKHKVRLLGGLPLIEVQQTPLDGWGRIIKRLFDISGFIFLALVLSPLLLIIAIAIKLLDPGPVLFTQNRLSRFGESFKIYKFRTLKQQYSGKDPIAVFEQMGRPELVIEYRERKKVANDPRLSRVGAWLRKISLDELPQLWNVLRGDLSLVGPRPYIEDELKQFGAQRSVFLSLKPGLTGLWQVSGRNQLSFEERVELEVYYAQNWSLLLDIKILLKTILVVIRREGAE